MKHVGEMLSYLWFGEPKLRYHVEVRCGRVTRSFPFLWCKVQPVECLCLRATHNLLVYGHWCAVGVN